MSDLVSQNLTVQIARTGRTNCLWCGRREGKIQTIKRGTYPPHSLADAEILNWLVALNAARAAEETRGVIRWLRPEYQAPNEALKTTGNLDLGDAPVLPATATIIPWPRTLPEQISAVAGLLQAAVTPLHPRDVARASKAKQANRMIPVLDTLTTIGMARKLADGRYAA